MREHFDNACFYVADLDAIQQRGNNHGTLEALLAAHPECAFFIDAGVRDVASLAELPRPANLRVILGSESLDSFARYHALRAAVPDALLSLDHRGDQRLGPAALWEAAATWPAQVIAMNLARVGAAAGPDLSLLQQLGTLAPHVTRIAAGGVRGPEDLEALASIGVHHVLVASALHDGSLTAADFANVPAPAKK